MNVGFSVVSRGRDVEFRRLGPCSSDRPPLVVSFCTPEYAAVLMGRLYYQRELLDTLMPRLPVAQSHQCEANDAALALAAYRQSGLKGLECLEGDFALVIWDAAEDRLVGCRDPLGGYPLFWTQHQGAVAFCTSLRPLLGLLPRRSLDPDYFADYLMVPGPVNERAGEHCAYDGIRRVRAGSIVTIRTSDRHVGRHAYWHWLERLTDPGTDRLDEVSDQYADLLRQAVRERIHGRTAAHLSGGMDSTAVSLIARDWICSGVGEAPLHTLSLVYNQLSGLARETPYLESALQQQKSIAAHAIAADDLLDFDSFTDPPPHDEPYVGLWRLGMDRATVETASTSGAVTLLTGLGADELLDVQPFHLTELLRQGRLRTAWAEACKWARVDNCSPWKILYPFGIANIFPAWTHGGLGRTLLPQARPSWKSHHDWAIAPWIMPRFAHRYALHRRAIDNARRTYRLCRSTGLSFMLSSIESRTGDVVRWSLAAPRGMAIAHPFLDPRVLRFSLGMQSRLRPEPGRLKPVLAEATRGLLPDTIRNRRRKGHFNEVYYLGLARNLPHLERMIQEAPIEDLGIIDKDVLRRCLQEAALGGVGVRSLHRFNLTLSLVKWLCLQHEWLRTPISSTEIVRISRQERAPQV